MAAKTLRHDDVKREALKDANVRQAYEVTDAAYQVARLRIMRGLTQQELADLVGTTQSSIARLESGRRDPSLSYLRRVLAALGYDICLQPVPLSEAQKAAPA